MKSSKDFYTKVKYTIDERLLETNSAVNAHVNRLLKLAYEAEDEALKEALLKSVEANSLVHYIKINGVLRIHDRVNVLHALKKADNAVLNIVESRLKECEKPEWQIIAEQNGWLPPLKRYE